MDTSQSSLLISVNQLALALDNSNDGIIITDANGNVIYATPSCDYDIAPDSFKNENVQNMVKKGIYEKSIIWEATQKKKQLTDVIKTKLGERVVSTATPMLDEEGNVTYVITNVRFANELERYTKALQEASASIDKYKNVINYINSNKSNNKKILTKSEKMLQILYYLKKVSASENSILLTGESGTGKELCSMFIHENSQCKREVFIPVNCSAIPKELAESEFFGYEKGAFSGALSKGKPGFFEMANHGTLFLDEVAEMSLDIQAKILRVLETGSFMRVGGTTPIYTDVRIVSATNRDLLQRVKDGAFREDLYYRLNVIPVHILPLRERKEDIIYLAEHFLSLANIRHNTNLTLSENMKKALLDYHWSGNVRELKNFIQRFAIIPDEEDILINSLPISKKSYNNKKISSKHVSLDSEPVLTLKEVTHQLEVDYIQQRLKACNGNVTAAAKQLGIHRSMLYRKMNQYGIRD